MALEWNPLSKPKPGREAEFLRLFRLMRRIRAIDPQAIDRCSLNRRWMEIQIPPHETLRAPRVGTDAVADEWVLSRYRDWPHPTQTEAEFIEEMRGFYVLPLAPAGDGLPVYSYESDGNFGTAEAFSFRAQLLHDCEEVIGRVTLRQCYKSCLASSLGALGDDMLALATQYADKTHVTDVEHLARPVFEEGSAAQKVHIVFAAAKWCKYWSSHGHGLAAHWQSEPA